MSCLAQDNVRDDSGVLGSVPTTSSGEYAGRSPMLTWFDRFASRVTRWAGSPCCSTNKAAVLGFIAIPFA